jgi:hypothetical protein
LRRDAEAQREEEEAEAPRIRGSDVGQSFCSFSLLAFFMSSLLLCVSARKTLFIVT